VGHPAQPSAQAGSPTADTEARTLRCVANDNKPCKVKMFRLSFLLLKCPKSAVFQRAGPKAGVLASARRARGDAAWGEGPEAVTRRQR